MKDYLKNNKLFIFIMVIGFIALFVQMNSVVYYADDFSLGIVSKQGFSATLEHFKTHYTTWGGGYTCLIVILLLMCDIIVWKFVNCVLIFITIALSVKMITHFKKVNKNIVALVLWFCFFILNIYTSKEVVYWVDGSMAYVFSTFQLFILFYYLYSKIIMKTVFEKYDFVLLPLVAFLAGWSSAQSGALAVGITFFFILWSKFINKDKIKPITWISLCLVIIGFCIFYFAPGNSSRMLVFEEYSQYSLIQKICYRVDGVYGLIFDFKTYQYMGMPFYSILFLGLLSVASLQILNSDSEKAKFKTKLMKICASIIICFLVLCLAISMNIPSLDDLKHYTLSYHNLLQEYHEGTFTIFMLIPYGISSIVMLCALLLCYYISQKYKNPLILALCLCAYIGQGLMVMAPYSPLRTTYISILFFWIAIAYLLYFMYHEKIHICLPFLIAFAIYNTNIGVLLLILYFSCTFILQDKESLRKELIISLAVFGLFSLCNYITITKNYYKNKNIYNMNIERINNFKESYKNDSSNKELYLLMPQDEAYGFTAMVGIDWIDEAIKDYFELDDDVVLLKEAK